MAEKIKDYKVFRCPHCSCEFFDKSAKKGKKVGNPLIDCPNCGKQAFRGSIIEPALISGRRYFDIRFSHRYGNMRIGLILIYAVFLFLIMVKRNMIMALYFVGFGLLLYVCYEAIRLVHMNSFLKKDEYNKAVEASVERLNSTPYAKMVTNAQGVDKDSVYYYQLHKADEAQENSSERKDSEK